MIHQPYTSHAEDAQLIVEYRSGDEFAFKALIEKHTDSVYAFIFQMVRDPASAEDVVQETFVKVWRHLGRYDRKKPFRTWLFAIAKNTAYDWLKKKRAIPFSAFINDGDETPFESLPDEELLPDQLLMREDAASEVNRVFGQLSGQYRALIVLVYQEGFSLHEAADILGEPYNTIKSRHRRAIRQLRTGLSAASITDGVT